MQAAKQQLAPDLETAKAFLLALDQEAYAFTFFAGDDLKQGRKPQQMHGEFPALADRLAALNNRAYGIFVAVNRTNLRGRKLSDITGVRAVWQEDDDGFTGALPLYPSIIVQSSPGKFHRYWSADGLTREQHEGVMARLVQDYGSDKAAKDLARVLRLPGFYHCKAEPRMVELVEANGLIYEAAEVLAAFPPIVDMAEPRPSRPIPKTDETEQVRAALRYVPAENYDEWYRIGAALKNGLGDAGRALWDEWASSAGPKFKMRAQDRKWNEIKPISKINLGTIFFIARQHGYWPRQERTQAALTATPPKAKTSAPLTDAVSAEVPDQWERDDKGALLKNRHNALIALKNMGIKLSHDEFAQQNNIEGLEGHGPHLSDAAMRALYLLVWDEYGLRFRREDLDAIVREECWRHRFHPVRDYLNGLEWDGVERIGEWLIAYGSAPDTPFVRTVGRIFLIAAVRRVRRPGCKFDEMLVWESPEGKDKSTALLTLAGAEWFSDEAPFGVPAREVIEKLRGRWIVECAELDSLRRSEITAAKRFLSAQADISTLKYERETTKAKRQCVFVGTTNEAAYLLSNTGNRRFWPVQVAQFDTESLKRDRDQLWAEAAYWEARGESIRLPRELYDEAAKEQEKRRVTDPWRDIIEDALGDLQGKVVAEDIWRLLDNGQKSRRTQNDNVRLGAIMRELGWRRPESGIKARGRRVRGYVKGGTPYPLLQKTSEGTAFERALAMPDDEE